MPRYLFAVRHPAYAELEDDLCGMELPDAPGPSVKKPLLIHYCVVAGALGEPDHPSHAIRCTVPVATPNWAAILWKPGRPGVARATRIRCSNLASVRGRPKALPL
jgi:hypothetical protein